MKFKKLAKLTGKLRLSAINVKDNHLVATNGFALAEVPFSQTGEPLENGAYKKAYFDGDIEIIADGKITYKNELEFEPEMQREIDFPKYEDLLKMDGRYHIVKIDVAILQKLLDVFKEQRDTKVQFLIKDSSSAMHLMGENVHGLIMPMLDEKKNDQ